MLLTVSQCYFSYYLVDTLIGQLLIVMTLSTSDSGDLHSDTAEGLNHFPVFNSNQSYCEAKGKRGHWAVPSEQL